MWLDEPILVDIQKRAAHVSIRLSSQWPVVALELRTRERVTQGEWNHIAVVSDGTGKASGLALYMNGLRAETDVRPDRLSGSIANDRGIADRSRKSQMPNLSQVGLTICVSTRVRSPLTLRFAATGVDLPDSVRSSPASVGNPPKPMKSGCETFYLRYVAPRRRRSSSTPKLRDLREENKQLEKQIVNHDGDERTREATRDVCSRSRRLPESDG